MKIYKISIVFLFLLIMTMGVVCAEDANQTAQDTLELTDTQEVVSNSSQNSFDDLFSKINASDDSITLDSDYKYSENDKIKFVQFTNIDYTINGNNHVIDADGKTYIFKAVNSSLTLKNLVLKNTNDTAMVVNNCNLTTVNVTFINTSSVDYGGSIYASATNYKSTNDKFTDTSAKVGGSAIYGFDSIIIMDNATFTSKNPIIWSFIYGNTCLIDVSNSVFANTTSKYATAIYNTFVTRVNKTKFINLKANATAGAIAVKCMNEKNLLNLTVDNCEFTNVSAGRNGGAIYADVNANTDFKALGFIEIRNTVFDKNTAEFGGALVQLGGNLDVYNSTFTNNIATEDGGAIFTSNATVNINKSKFTNNRAGEIDGHGGAIHLDYETATIDGSAFTDNVAGIGEAIYSYSTFYTIKNSQFKNNDLYTRFDDDGSNITDCGEYNATVDDRNITYIIRHNGQEIILNPQNITGSAKDSYFNLNDLGLVTPVKNQGSMGACWSFGAAGAFESAYLIATGIEIDISENNIQNLGMPYSEYGQIYNTEGGNMDMSASYFMSWLGAVPTTDDFYDELGKVSAVKYSPDAIRALNAVFINITDKNAIKEFLTKYGAMNIFVYGANARDGSYSDVYKSVYNSKNYGNHYVTLVGWNDTFSKNNFVNQAPGDGAWICKNSWGTEWGDGGYFYLSYYDKSLTANAVGFTFENTEYYETLYQNEVNGWYTFNSNYNTYGQLYTSENGDIIAAVGTYFEKANSPYTISVYVANRLVYNQTGVSDHAGYETVKLNKYISVDKNTTFEIRIQSSSMPMVQLTRGLYVFGTNYAVDNDGPVDLAKDNIIAPVKVYTFHNTGIAENIIKYYNNQNATVFTVHDIYGTDSIPASFNNTNYTIHIENNTGNISLGILPVGDYLVTVTYNNQTIAVPVVIKTTIDSDDQKSVTLAYGATETFTVQFFYSNGTALANTTVSIKFDGKALSKTITDEKGMFLINIGVISIGKHYIDYVNPKTTETLRVTLNIVSRFVGNANINMYYFDGHTYKVRVKDNYGNFVGKNQVVTIKIGKKTYKVKTDAKGYATLKIPSKITPGKYTISATYKGQTVKNKLTVKQVLKTTKTVKVKKTAKKLVLKATLKKGKTAIKSKVIKFKVNGKTYKAKTNSKGIAKVTIKKAAIKKLKAGKKYTVKVSYLSDVVKATLKVRR